ncbi:hypothetical protein IWX65_000270 [Arthrobacter sp. CAN_A214]
MCPTSAAFLLDGGADEAESTAGSVAGLIGANPFLIRHLLLEDKTAQWCICTSEPS